MHHHSACLVQIWQDLRMDIPGHGNWRRLLDAGVRVAHVFSFLPKEFGQGTGA
jgi:hypothetical protein